MNPHELQSLDTFYIQDECNLKSKKVTIVQVTDLHQWPKDYFEFENKGTVMNIKEAGYDTSLNVSLIEDICDRIKPTIVMLTGDILDSRPLETHGDWKETFMDVVRPLIERKIYWSFIPGNHDHDNDNCPYTRDDLLEIYQFPYCFSKDATSFNHTINLTLGPRENKSLETRLNVRLWLLDSGVNDDVHRYTTFNPHIVERFSSLSSELKLLEPACSTSLMYFHIPLPEYGGLTPLVGVNGVFDAAYSAGMVPFPFNYVPGFVKLLGYDRVVGCSKLNSGLYDALVKDGSILATFCGHDHHSDAIFKREGNGNIYLGYGRCGSYTPPSDWEKKAPQSLQKGCRIVEIKRKNDDLSVGVNTWIETSGESDESSFFTLQ